MSDHDLRDWLAAALGGEVTRWEQLVAGNSRTTWLADATTPDGERALVVRSEAGDGPFAGTELTLAREAALYAALRGRGVRVAELIAYDAQRDAIAMTRLDGAPDWSGAVLDDLLRELPVGLDGPDAAPDADPGVPDGGVIGHVHLNVSDIPQAEAFYSGVLGFDVVVRSYPGALFVSAGGYHHHLGLNTWSSAGGAPNTPDTLGLDGYTVVLPDAAAVAEAVERLTAAGAAPGERDGAPLATDPFGNSFTLVAGA